MVGFKIFRYIDDAPVPLCLSREALVVLFGIVRLRRLKTGALFLWYSLLEYRIFLNNHSDILREIISFTQEET